MEKKTKKRLKKFLIFGGIIAVGVAGGIVAYKKVPAFKGAIDTATGKIKGLVKKETKYPEFTTIRTPRPGHIDKHGVATKK